MLQVGRRRGDLGSLVGARAFTYAVGRGCPFWRLSSRMVRASEARIWVSKEESGLPEENVWRRGFFLVGTLLLLLGASMRFGLMVAA